MTDLKKAFAALSGKQNPYNELFSYMDGNQPLKYSTIRLQEAFRTINVHFQQNWCEVVIQSTLDRMQLAGWDASDKAANDILDEAWNELQINLEAMETHNAALVAGEAFIICWMDDEDQPEVYFNDPRLCAMFYDEEKPREKAFAAKWWADGQKYTHITLYYADRLEYYVTRGASDLLPLKADEFVPAEIPQAPNPYGVIPVFHYRTSRRGNGSELKNVISLQDAINKLFADMMVSAEYSAFRQRYIISESDTSTLKNAPNEIWEIKDTESKVGEFPAGGLDVFLEAIDKIVASISVITRTPKHYFFQAGGEISGDALIAMEAPLNKKVEQIEAVFSSTWKELAVFLLELYGVKGYKPSDITPLWKPIESIQPFAKAQTRQLAVASGIPLVTAVRREGWSQAEIEELVKDQEEEKKKQTTLAKALLEQARVEQEQRNSVGVGEYGSNGVNGERSTVNGERSMVDSGQRGGMNG